MRLVRRGRPTASLFVRLLIFAAVTLLAAQAISLVMIVKLPRPLPDIYRVDEIERALQEGGLRFSDRPALKVRRQAEPPGPPMLTQTVHLVRSRIAADLDKRRREVRIAGTYRPVRDMRAVRAIYERMGQLGARPGEFLVAPFEVGVRQPDGDWLVVSPSHGWRLNSWELMVVSWFALSALAVAPVAYLFARHLSAPTRLLAKAAERLGRDPRAPPLELKGSPEITVAVAAFNDMQAKLRRYVEDRTAMVAAVAHDLRTPLTRLRFRIESAPEEQRAKMAADIEQMEQMIAATLAFVRDASRPAERTPLELSSLIQSLCDELAETGARAAMLEPSEKVVIDGDPMALRRLFTNLLENALKFGGKAEARVFAEGDYAIVEVDDDGPGIPQEERERVFEPFYRREPSRSRETGGAGLGLAVVRSVARAHGGDVVLSNRSGGGLTARVLLPL